jgi:hypothetical protein
MRPKSMNVSPSSSTPFEHAASGIKVGVGDGLAVGGGTTMDGVGCGGGAVGAGVAGAAVGAGGWGAAVRGGWGAAVPGAG